MSKFVYFHYKRIVGKKQEKTEKSTIFHGPDCAGTASLKQYLSYRIIMITNDYQKNSSLQLLSRLLIAPSQ
ncbi:hypothetical protein, partial [Mitsuokella jalaludinii]